MGKREEAWVRVKRGAERGEEWSHPLSLSLWLPVITFFSPWLMLSSSFSPRMSIPWAYSTVQYSIARNSHRLWICTDTCTHAVCYKWGPLICFVSGRRWHFLFLHYFTQKCAYAPTIHTYKGIVFSLLPLSTSGNCRMKRGTLLHRSITKWRARIKTPFCVHHWQCRSKKRGRKREIG